MMINYSVSAQTFTAATVIEDEYPTGLSQFSKNTSAHSVPVPLLTGSQGFLYVHTWDGGDDLTGNFDAGFAVQLFDGDATNGTFIANDVIHDNDMASVEAVILDDGTQTYHILLTYYRISNQTFEIDLWEWDPSAGLTQITGYPQAIDPGSVGVPFGWIRLDAIGYHDYVATWSYNNKLFVAGGHFIVGSAVPLSHTYEIMPDITNSWFPNGFDRPDIAMSGDNLSIETFLVFLDDDHDELGVIEIPFSTILAAPAPFPLPTNTAQYNVPGGAIYGGIPTTTGRYHFPRIDAPDENAVSNGSRVWSYVVQNTKFNPITNIDHNYIYAGLYENNILGALFTDYNLNDGITITAGDISESVDVTTGMAQTNSMPVVAFDFWHAPSADWTIYYGWYHQNHSPQANLSTIEDGYIGVRLKYDRTSFWANEYFVIPDDPDNVSLYPSLAFSCNNMRDHNGIYMAFTQQDATTADINIGYKFVDWSATSFRPTPPEEENNNSLSQISIFPNPFTDGFTLKAVNNNEDIFQLHITDILGRTMVNHKGQIEKLNELLNTEPEKWDAGQYIIQVNNNNTGAKETIKMVKIK